MHKAEVHNDTSRSLLGGFASIVAFARLRLNVMGLYLLSAGNLEVSKTTFDLSPPLCDADTQGSLPFG